MLLFKNIMHDTFKVYFYILYRQLNFQMLCKNEFNLSVEIVK